MDKLQKREAVLDAILEAVAECGFHGASMSQVAERGGVGAGTIYRYFDGKDALIAACYHGLEDRFLSAVMKDYPERRPVRERFLHMATTLVRHFTAHPRDLRFLQQFHDSPYGANLRKERMFGKNGKNIVRELLEQGRAQQIVRDLPLPVLFALAFAPLLHLCRDYAAGFVEPDERVLEETVRACWDALKR